MRTPKENFACFFDAICKCESLDDLDELEDLICDDVTAGYLTKNMYKQLVDEIDSKRSYLVEQEL